MNNLFFHSKSRYLIHLARLICHRRGFFCHEIRFFLLAISRVNIKIATNIKVKTNNSINTALNYVRFFIQNLRNLVSNKKMESKIPIPTLEFHIQ